MRTINLDSLSSEILHGEDSVLLLGISWTELAASDSMVKLTVVQSAPEGREVPRAVDVLMHRITRLRVFETGEHIGPMELDISDQIEIDGVLYDILQISTASWHYLQTTHQF